MGADIARRVPFREPPEEGIVAVPGGRFLALYVDESIRRNVDRLDLGFDGFGVDPFGVSKNALVAAYSPFAWLYRNYLHVTTFGMEHLPATGRALLISNHTGGIGTDAAMLSTSLLLNEDAPRLGHGMAEYFFNTLPFASQLMARVGNLTGIPEHAELLLSRERLVLAFPEGTRGTNKLYKDRYRLERFGTGFMRLALKMRAPIIPIAFIGGEEAFPIIFRIEFLGKLVGVPFLPVAPQLLLFPLPVACQLHFGEPMHFDGDGRESDAVIDEYVDRVKARIARLIDEGLAMRPAAFTRKMVVNPNDPTWRGMPLPARAL